MVLAVHLQNGGTTNLAVQVQYICREGEGGKKHSTYTVCTYVHDAQVQRGVRGIYNAADNGG